MSSINHFTKGPFKDVSIWQAPWALIILGNFGCLVEHEIITSQQCGRRSRYTNSFLPLVVYIFMTYLSRCPLSLALSAEEQKQGPVKKSKWIDSSASGTGVSLKFQSLFDFLQVLRAHNAFKILLISIRWKAMQYWDKSYSTVYIFAPAKSAVHATATN